MVYIAQALDQAGNVVDVVGHLVSWADDGNVLVRDRGAVTRIDRIVFEPVEPYRQIESYINDLSPDAARHQIAWLAEQMRQGPGGLTNAAERIGIVLADQDPAHIAGIVAILPSVISMLEKMLIHGASRLSLTPLALPSADWSDRSKHVLNFDLVDEWCLATVGVVPDFK